MKKIKFLLFVALLGSVALACNKKDITNETHSNIKLYNQRVIMSNDFSESTLVFSAIKSCASNNLKDSVNTWINHVLSSMPANDVGDGVDLFAGSIDSLRQMANYYVKIRLVEDLDKEEVDFLKKLKIKYYDFDSVKIYHNDGLTSVIVYSESFRGGAHPNHEEQSAVFDNQTGHSYNCADIFKDTLLLKKAIVQGLKQYFKVSSNKDLQQMLFEDVQLSNIPLPNNIPYFSDKDLVITYKDYEIAPYAAGSPKIFIPFKDCKKILNEDIFEKLKVVNK